MYIPWWAIIILIVVLLMYFKPRQEKKMAQSSFSGIEGKNFSYKLEIRLSPWWGKLYRKIAEEDSESGKEFDKNFEKKISFFQGDKKEILLLGSSPAFRKVHARVQGQGDVFAVDFNSYEAGTKPQDWENKNFLHLDRDQIDRVETPSFAVSRQEDKFTLEGLSEKEKTNEAEIDSFLSRVTGLSFQEVLGNEKNPSYKQDSPEFTFSVQFKSGGKTSFVFSNPEGEEDFLVLKTSSSDSIRALAAE